MGEGIRSKKGRECQGTGGEKGLHFDIVKAVRRPDVREEQPADLVPVLEGDIEGTADVADYNGLGLLDRMFDAAVDAVLGRAGGDGFLEAVVPKANSTLSGVGGYRLDVAPVGGAAKKSGSVGSEAAGEGFD